MYQTWTIGGSGGFSQHASLYYNKKTAVINIDAINYLAFTAVEDSVIKLATFDISAQEITTDTPAVNLEYSMNGIDFQEWNYETQLYAGKTLYLRGDNPTGFNSMQAIYTFGASTGKFECHGNVMSLLYNDDFEGKLTIPGDYCFCFMFYGCTSLTTAPELPATTLATSCYGGMFTGCTSLTTAPELPATTLAMGCYSSMFSGCTSLTIAPELPATTLATSCYNSMFSGCTSLRTAPELPATTLADRCYSNMFRGCTKLTYIAMFATDISAEDCLNNWVYNVASTGTFIKHPNITSLPTGSAGIPEGWTVTEGTITDGGNVDWGGSDEEEEVVEPELDESGTQSSTGGTIGGDGNDGDISIEYPDDYDPFA